MRIIPTFIFAPAELSPADASVQLGALVGRPAARVRAAPATCAFAGDPGSQTIIAPECSSVASSARGVEGTLEAGQRADDGVALHRQRDTHVARRPEAGAAGPRSGTVAGS